MAKVRYVQGKKASYLALNSYDPMALYWCTDTKELFKGDQLYSDGVRIVLNYESLPAFSVAADGILYYCKSNGCGYVLNEERNGWLVVIHGLDNETISLNEQGLISVEAVSISKVTGLSDELQRIEKIAIDGCPVATTDKAGVVKPGSEFAVAADGTLSLTAVEIEKISGLEERLSTVEQVAVGGVHYCGAVDTYEDLPTDAKKGDLYEVYADNSEWCFNGKKWFEYGKTVNIDLTPYAEKDEVRDIAQMVKYEISSKPVGTLVRYGEAEIRVMCPADTVWEKQNVGATGNANMYYMGFKAYAPENAVSFKEGDQGIVEDKMFYFEGNDFAGIDKYGRKYSICWLALASYDAASDTWTYFGKKSTVDKYIGWTYVVEWYDATGVKIADDSIRINLSNEDCHNNATPYYISNIQTKLTSLENSMTWEDM